jgi:hypothetical protein
LLKTGFLCLAIALSSEAARAATIVVNDESSVFHGDGDGCGVSGTGLCSLVDAIVFANANPGNDSIRFNIGGGGIRTILPTAQLPALTDDAGVTIDGFTQPGGSSNTLAAGSNAVWRILLSGASSHTSGILIHSDHNVVRGLVFQNWTHGVEVVGGAENLVSGNLIGQELQPGEFTNSNGVTLRAGAHDNRIGGTEPSDRNVISGNGAGIFLTDPGTSSNVIQGNIVGLSSSGLTVMRNFRGISLYQGSPELGPSFNLIGGTTAGAANVVSGNETNGVDLLGVMEGNRIEGNLIGTTTDGTTAAGNLQAGVGMFGAARSNVVGGTAPGAGNLISGNGIGVNISGFEAEGNRVEGNRIGTTPQGDAAIPNGSGVDISFGSGNVVGGFDVAARNVISGNVGSAVSIARANGHSVLGNLIGTDASGIGRLGNGSQIGSAYHAIQIVGASQNRAEANVIAYNGNQWVGGGGIIVLEGNEPGDTVGNVIRGNSIHDNLGLGIDLYEPEFPYRVTPNDSDDGDSGPNSFQNYPVIHSVSFVGGLVDIAGTLNSTASTSFALEFFASRRCDDSKHGEGEVFLGSHTVTTDAAGTASFQVVMSVPTSAARRISATATDPAGNTSEFSRCFPEENKFYTVSACRVADTRDPIAPWGGPALMGGEVRRFVVAGRCGIPETAQAVAFNFTSTGSNRAGNLTVFPVGSLIPLASTVNFEAGRTRANNAIIPLGTGGEIAIQASHAFGSTSHVVIDVTGYFE